MPPLGANDRFRSTNCPPPIPLLRKKNIWPDRRDHPLHQLADLQARVCTTDGDAWWTAKQCMEVGVIAEKCVLLGNRKNGRCHLTTVILLSCFNALAAQTGKNGRSRVFVEDNFFCTAAPMLCSPLFSANLRFEKGGCV